MSSRSCEGLCKQGTLTIWKKEGRAVETEQASGTESEDAAGRGVECG